jgi:hypothetical protein
MVVQKKVMMNEELRKIQYEVYELEDRVYGNRKYGSLGLYGVLRDCRLQISDTKNGGDGKLKWTEPIDRVTDKEEEFKIVFEYATVNKHDALIIDQTSKHIFKLNWDTALVLTV